MNGGANPDSKKAVKRRKEAKARQPEHHAAGLGDEIEAASLATSKGRAERKRSRQIDEDEARERSRSRLRHRRASRCRLRLNATRARNSF